MRRHFLGTKGLYFSTTEPRPDMQPHKFDFDHFAHRFSDHQLAHSKAISTDGAESFDNESSACTVSAKIAVFSCHAAVLWSREIEGLPD